MYSPIPYSISIVILFTVGFGRRTIRFHATRIREAMRNVEPQIYLARHKASTCHWNVEFRHLESNPVRAENLVHVMRPGDTR